MGEESNILQPESRVLFQRRLERGGNNFLEQISDAVELVAGHGDVEGVGVGQAVALVNCASGGETEDRKIRSEKKTTA